MGRSGSNMVQHTAAMNLMDRWASMSYWNYCWHCYCYCCECCSHVASVTRLSFQQAFCYKEHIHIRFHSVFFVYSRWVFFCSLLLDCWLATIRSDDQNKCLCWKAVKVSLFPLFLAPRKKGLQTIWSRG